MPSWINVGLQVAALTAATVMRFLHPGWLAIIFVFSVIGPLLVFGHALLAVRSLDLPHLPASLAVPFLLSAASLVAANLLLTDMDDGRDYPSPLETIVGPVPDTTGLGAMMLLVWCGALLWATIVLDLKKTEFRRTTGQGPVGSPA